MMKKVVENNGGTVIKAVHKAVHESICGSSRAIRNESDSEPDLHPTDPGQIRSDSWMTCEIRHFSKSQQPWAVVVAFFNLNEFPTIFVDQKTKKRDNKRLLLLRF